MNTDTNKCPHCGAEASRYSDPHSPHADGGLYYYECGYSSNGARTVNSDRTDLCREREARQKAEADAVKNGSRALVLAKLLTKAVAITEGFRETLELVTDGDVDCKQLTELNDEIERFRASLKE